MEHANVLTRRGIDMQHCINMSVIQRLTVVKMKERLYNRYSCHNFDIVLKCILSMHR
jgi:hypothetical protein